MNGDTPEVSKMTDRKFNFFLRMWAEVAQANLELLFIQPPASSLHLPSAETSRHSALPHPDRNLLSMAAPSVIPRQFPPPTEVREQLILLPHFTGRGASHREVESLATQPVSGRGRKRTQAGWCPAYIPSHGSGAPLSTCEQHLGHS